MATKGNPGNYDCYGGAAQDEPIFTLRSTDPTAPGLVVAWAAIRCGNIEEAERAIRCAAEALEKSGKPLKPRDDPKLVEARKCADEMFAYYMGFHGDGCGVKR